MKVHTMTWFPEDVTEAQTVCALRILGYEYERSADLLLSGLIEPIVKSRVLLTDQNANFAAFFGLQRFLHKWGYLTKYAAEHFAYAFLFLHLYRPERRARLRVRLPHAQRQARGQDEGRFLPRGAAHAEAVADDLCRRRTCPTPIKDAEMVLTRT